MPLVTLNGACLAFGDVALLDHVGLVLDSGERVALIGRNGSGKTSLLKAIAGVQTLDDGTLWREDGLDRKSTRLNSSHIQKSRMPSSA